ncbi:MAG: hypothetical protein ACJAUH_001101 [Saprospiraceae bacterium]|jgi:uncharacterized protein (DUF1015 family)
MHIHPFKASLPNLERIFNPALFFSKAKHLYPAYHQNGYFSKLENEALFIYRQKNGTECHIGILAATHIQDYFNESIIRHEETIGAKEERMLRLFDERNGQIKPVLLTYPTVPEISTFLKNIIETKTPDQSIKYKDTEHDFWFLQSEEECNYLTQLFRDKVEKAYIADGHHRAATLARYYNYTLKRLGILPKDSPYNYLYCAFFGTDELTISDYNRVVKVGRDFDVNAFLKQLETVAEITPCKEAFKPSNGHEIAILITNNWYRLKWKTETILQDDSQIKQLDVSLLNKHIFNNILQMNDIRNVDNVTYIGGDRGIQGVVEKVNQSKGIGIGFMLYPISTADFMTIVDKEGVMPPKSTYFIPRINNAFVNLMFD